MAAAKLGRGSVHDKRMHLRDVNGKEVSITVDVVDTTKELLEGEDPSPGVLKPLMVLTPGDERRIQGMMLTGWMGKADLLNEWASQGKKKGQPTQEARRREAGEQVRFKHLKVKTDGRTLRISALFDRNVPNTTIGYGAATILGLKGGRASHRVTTADGKKEISYAWYDVPLLGVGGHTSQVKASGVVSTARIKVGGRNGEVCGSPPGETAGSTRGWECADLIIGRDNMDCEPEDIRGWRGWSEGVYPMRGTGTPGNYVRTENREDPTGGTERFARANQQPTGECLAPMV
jgi:hypothetical protein